MTEQRTGRVNSGDVSIFYRAFGSRGATPILILHGANYFDSYDWIDVAAALAGDREVVAYDKRGFGESTWSASKDYSVDAKRFMLKRDPDFQNVRPQGEGANLPQRPSRDVWQELAEVKCPTVIVRGTRSDRYPPEIVARISRDHPRIAWATVDSQHDVADQAPRELVAAVRKFVAGA